MVSQENNLTQGKSPVNGTDDREARQRFWIAAYTRPRSEKKAAEGLKKNKIETYVPIQTIERQWSDRKKKVDVVVIPMVIFARIATEDLLTIKKHTLIIKVLSYPGKKQPAIIPEDQIENLRLMLQKAETKVEFIRKAFNLTDRVIVKTGKLEGLVGRVERICGSKTKLVVSIDMLGGAMVEINTEDLEIYND